MDKLFLEICNMSVTASYVILFVLLARIFLKKAPKTVSYFLWSVVLFRLSCPFSFESIFSIFSITGRDTNDIRPFPAEFTTIVPTETVIQAPNSTVVITPLGRPPFGLIFTAFWLSGIAVLLIYSLVTLYKLTKKLKSATPLKENIYLSDNVSTAFVLGVLRPKIYLPLSLSGKEQEYILLHEKTHLKRLDHIVKILAFLVLCVHWFNPFVWVAFFAFTQDMELSCDEAVIKTLGSEVKKDYSTSLLSLAAGRRIIGGTPLAFGEGDTKNRVKNALIYKKPARWVIVVSVVAIVAMGMGLAANPTSDRVSMQWAKRLRIDDIASVELVTTYGDENNRYQHYEPEQFPDIVKLVNGSRGKYIPQPEAIAGGGETLYINTLDGMRHSVGNTGNVYLVIDGDSFQMSSFAVDGWDWYSNGNAAIPEAFDDTLSVASNFPIPKFGAKISETVNLEKGYESISLRDVTREQAAAYLKELQENGWTAVDTFNQEATIGGLYQMDAHTLSVQFAGELLTIYYAVTAEAATLPDDIAVAEYSFLKMSKNGEVLAADSLKNQELAKAIIMNGLVKSAAWEGVDVSSLEESYLIRWKTSEAQLPSDYYAYLLPLETEALSAGTPVLQSGLSGIYSALSVELYAQLVALF